MKISPARKAAFEILNRIDSTRAFSSVLLPDNRLAELIEKRDLSRLRKKLGMQFALTDLRERLEIQIWKNSFRPPSCTPQAHNRNQNTRSE